MAAAQRSGPVIEPCGSRFLASRLDAPYIRDESTRRPQNPHYAFIFEMIRDHIFSTALFVLKKVKFIVKINKHQENWRLFISNNYKRLINH